MTDGIFYKVIEELSQAPQVGLDVEATGLSQDDRLFSLQLATPHQEYYFNYQDYGTGMVLDKKSTIGVIAHVLKGKTIFIHNAKYDLRMLYNEGIFLDGDIHCTYAIERVIKNNYFGKDSYSLAALAKRRGLAKDDSVSEYIAKHKLYTEVRSPGKKKVTKLLHFDKVPFDIITNYGCKDAELALKIGIDQQQTLLRLEQEKPPDHPSWLPVYHNEKRLTTTLFAMERTGIRINRQRTSLALEYELGAIADAKKNFKNLTGLDFSDSNKFLKEVFDRLGCMYPLTEKGNPSFAADVLDDMDNPAANAVNKIRHHEKRAGTYYASFLHYATKTDILHADARQAGTESGRMSYREPNLQNCPKESDPEDLYTPYHVRECFIPRERKVFHSIDYQQMELCLMHDYAGEMRMIKRINDGEDCHAATADEVGITRKQAKVLNFMIPYGSGDAKIAKVLGISQAEARDLRLTFFGRLPYLQRLFRRVADMGKARGYIFNWYGRRNFLSHNDFAYVLPNHLIQGSAAEICKKAMNDIYDRHFSTSMLLQVHDELLFESYPEELEEIPKIQTIMEQAYTPRNGVILRTSVQHSPHGWGSRQLKEGIYAG